MEALESSEDEVLIASMQSKSSCGMTMFVTLIVVADWILRALETRLRASPPRRVYYINTLPGPDFGLAHPIAVMVDETGKRALAKLEEAELEAEGKTAREAVIGLREVIVRTFVALNREAPDSGEDAAQLATLSSLIRRKTVRMKGSKFG